jgi:hypothetical protein
MSRSRINEDQVVDEGFVSEREFNDFFASPVITGTIGRDDTEITTTFDSYLPGRGLFVGSDGNTVTTGTEFIQIDGFYTEFTNASGTLQAGIGTHIHDDRYYTEAELGSTEQNHASGAELIGIPIISGATYRSSHELMNLFFSAGRATGGEITDVGSETIMVASGTGFIKAEDVDTAELLSFDWSTVSGITIPTNSTRFIGVTYSGGSPSVDVRAEQNWDLDTGFPLGSVINLNAVLYVLSNPWWVTDGLTNVIERFSADHGYLSRDSVVGGLILGVTGVRYPTMTAGTVWSRLNEFEMSAIDYSISGSFNTYWFESDGAVHEDTPSPAQYPITQWNDIENDQLDTIGNNQYAVWWVFLNVTNNQLALMYPKATHPSSASAEAEELPSHYPGTWYLEGLVVGRIIIREGEDEPVAVQSAFTMTFTADQAADHGNLGGLGDDDHTHYSLVNGTRAFSGVVGGVTPTSAVHLTTKSYVDTADTTISGHLQTQIDGVGGDGVASIVVSGTTLSGSVVFEGLGSSSLHVSGQTITFSGGASGGASDHGALSGLDDDDHLQYLLVNGGRALSGDWDNTGRRIRNTGTAEVAGSAPTTPATGLLWLDTAASGSGGTGVLAVDTVTTDTELDTSNTVVLCDAAGGAILITLIEADGNVGRNYYVKKIDSSANTVTVSGATGDLLDEGATAVLTIQYESITTVSDGTGWWIL